MLNKIEEITHPIRITDGWKNYMLWRNEDVVNIFKGSVNIEGKDVLFYLNMTGEEKTSEYIIIVPGFITANKINDGILMLSIDTVKYSEEKEKIEKRLREEYKGFEICFL